MRDTRPGQRSVEGELADRQHSLRDSVRGLLETEFDTVFMVATEASLLEGVGRLDPAVVLVEVALSAGDRSELLGRIGARAPRAKLMLLSRARRTHGRGVCGRPRRRLDQFDCRRISLVMDLPEVRVP